MRNFSQRRNPRTPKTQKMAEEEEVEVRTESENSESSSSDDPKTPENKTTEYEKQRELVIARNKARMESMGLQKIAKSLMNLGHKEGKKRKSQHKSIKSKKDDEYEPDNDDEEQKDDSSEATLDNSSEEFEQEKKKKKITNARNSKSHSKKVVNRKLRSDKQVSLQKFPDVTDLMSEDEALKQAMALSLKDIRDTSFVQQHDGLSQGSNELAASSNGKGCDRSQKDDTRRKKKSFKSRMQMTEDDLVVNFCQFDESKTILKHEVMHYDESWQKLHTSFTTAL
ncbi:uncharacterized protein LOC104905352 isoform X3 [Beta vulgaris subsp. vulgaris]|uniref:uncharacterized protein LOC104905352 isoform X3 n=1 Tax=Beta vulgaris subsp. vulgaris TaxID=3555 RepID=UPI002037659F|nr:uncharacterized protein LOC104905352 isoform X3 [Beta vulgaris subsp. vulgaris]